MFEMLKHLTATIDADADADTTQAHWVRTRRAPRDCDHAVTGTTRRWLRGLPARRRPLRLCESHPRVANRIAWCWNDPELTDTVLQDLLVDRRGGRQGFAPILVRELQRLREFNAQQRVELGPEGLLQMAARVAGLG